MNSATQRHSVAGSVSSHPLLLPGNYIVNLPNYSLSWRLVEISRKSMELGCSVSLITITRSSIFTTLNDLPVRVDPAHIKEPRADLKEDLDWIKYM